MHGVQDVLPDPKWIVDPNLDVGKCWKQRGRSLWVESYIGNILEEAETLFVAQSGEASLGRDTCCGTQVKYG